MESTVSNLSEQTIDELIDQEATIVDLEGFASTICKLVKNSGFYEEGFVNIQIKVDEFLEHLLHPVNPQANVITRFNTTPGRLSEDDPNAK